MRSLKKYRTSCCKSTWSKVGRAHYICDKCNKDVTVELALVVEMLETNKKK